jgi:hypothetical protein
MRSSDLLARKYLLLHVVDVVLEALKHFYVGALQSLL